MRISVDYVNVCGNFFGQIFSQEGFKKKEVQQEYHKLMMVICRLIFV